MRFQTKKNISNEKHSEVLKNRWSRKGYKIGERKGGKKKGSSRENMKDKRWTVEAQMIG